MTYDIEPAIEQPLDTRAASKESFKRATERIDQLLASNKTTNIPVQVQDEDGKLAVRTEQTCFLKLKDGPLWRVFAYTDSGVKNHYVEVNIGSEFARVYQVDRQNSMLVSEPYQMNGTTILGSEHTLNDKESIDDFNMHLGAAQPLSPTEAIAVLAAQTYVAQPQA